jgi:tryptophan 7-halogenase
MGLKVKDVLIVGGGTAGWITAGYLARMLSADTPNGIRITVVESADIGIIGVGEGTFPSIRKTLKRIGIDESDLVREANATFKQGIRFVDWRHAPGSGQKDHYFHPFQVANQSDGLELINYWLLGVAGDVNWDEVNTVQKAVSDAALSPKLITHEQYAGPLNYAYHFDAVALARLLRKKAIELGVHHVVDTVLGATLSADGSIDHLTLEKTGTLKADLYVDCSGFRAQLIGEALGVPFQSCRDQLFTNSAVAMQVPYGAADTAIPSYTIATAHDAGWTWDIGLNERRGTGYVYSTDHTSDDQAEALLRRYVGKDGDGVSARILRFEPGYRRTQWHKNCVAIGLSCGFIEPLEATGIGFAEIAALILTNLFPFAGNFETCARQFNAIMVKRYEHVVDFIKLHYCLTERRDQAFWQDNVAASSISDSLKERLDRWRHRAPSFMDVDLNHDIFTEANWQYVLYGMGYQTDLSHQAQSFKFYDDAQGAFADIRKQAEYAKTIMPRHRDLIDMVRQSGFTPRRAA